MIIDSSVVLDELPEGDTGAFNAGSKLDAENMPATTEESNHNNLAAWQFSYCFTGILYLEYFL